MSEILPEAHFEIPPGLTVVVPASDFLRQRIAGLSGIARSVIMADLAGARTIHIIADRPVPQDWHRSFAVRERPLPDVIIESEAPRADSGDRLLVLDPDRLTTAHGLDRLIAGEPPAALHDGSDYYTAAPASEIGWRIMTGSMKPGEGWVGRNINRPISFRIASFLLRFDISPNPVTWFTLGLAVVMSVLLSLGGPLWLAVGGALYQAVSVIDCVDGDIARVSYQRSRNGAAFDTACDMLANMGFVVGVTIGIVRTYGTLHLEVALAMVVVAALCIAAMTLLVRAGPGKGSFDVLRAALTLRLAQRPLLGKVVLTGEKMFKRDFYALLAAVLCVSGLAWVIPQAGLVGVIIWLLAIVWCAPLIAGDKHGALLPAHLRER